MAPVAVILLPPPWFTRFQRFEMAGPEEMRRHPTDTDNLRADNNRELTEQFGLSKR